MNNKTNTSVVDMFTTVGVEEIWECIIESNGNATKIANKFNELYEDDDIFAHAYFTGKEDYIDGISIRGAKITIADIEYGGYSEMSKSYVVLAIKENNTTRYVRNTVIYRGYGYLVADSTTGREVFPREKVAYNWNEA